MSEEELNNKWEQYLNRTEPSVTKAEEERKKWIQEKINGIMDDVNMKNTEEEKKEEAFSIFYKVMEESEPARRDAEQWNSTFNTLEIGAEEWKKRDIRDLSDNECDELEKSRLNLKSEIYNHIMEYDDKLYKLKKYVSFFNQDTESTSIEPVFVQFLKEWKAIETKGTVGYVSIKVLKKVEKNMTKNKMKWIGSQREGTWQDLKKPKCKIQKERQMAEERKLMEQKKLEETERNAAAAAAIPEIDDDDVNTLSLADEFGELSNPQGLETTSTSKCPCAKLGGGKNKRKKNTKNKRKKNTKNKRKKYTKNKRKKNTKNKRKKNTKRSTKKSTKRKNVRNR